ncbi:MAG TPA: MupA/Atu3671 family FMN-dependent luciferase-like monooxygenase [Chloroflexota bacterium]|nr:MupA/Atu3671 family FMN-dependent luciferase-like monooxygenase [Chloroflexota bacterium]
MQGRATPGTTVAAAGILDAARLSALNDRLSRHEAFWVRRLSRLEPIDLPYARRSSTAAGAPEHRGVPFPIPPSAREALAAEERGGDHLVAAFAVYLAKLAGAWTFDLGYSEPAIRQAVSGLERYVATHVPLRVLLDKDGPISDALQAMREALATVRQRLTYVRDVVPRYPELSGLLAQVDQPQPVAATVPVYPVVVEQMPPGQSLEAYQPQEGSELTLVVAADGSAARWFHDPRVFDAADVAAMQEHYAVVLDALLTCGAPARVARCAPSTGGGVHRVAQPLASLPLLSEAQRRQLLVSWNQTQRAYAQDACIHHLVEAQAARSPQAVAVVGQGGELTYRELQRRAAKLAAYLQTLGVGPDVLVGLCAERSVDLVVGLLGILEAGGAYVPLDPSYPRERLELVAADARLPVLVTQGALAGKVTCPGATVVRLDDDWPAIEAHHGGPLDRSVGAANLAYVIYTSGSTGTPKGVMVEHRNAVNFLAGMDERLEYDPPGPPPQSSEPGAPARVEPAQRATREGVPNSERLGKGYATPGVWLAVTSLAFDISVLELLWTLARGFKVVLYCGSDRALPDHEVALQPHPGAGGGRAGQESAGRLEFSLFYFASDEGEKSSDKYRLLLEGARFADRNGFAALWTPERHFHAFGGLYPNPAVTGAAVAAVTERIQIRAGSCVLPLHHPIRVAEEWALVDSLSQGRVGISFASGWQPNDFVLAPERFSERKGLMVRQIEMVRRLWRGEAVGFPGPQGREVAVRTLPRPVQPELPVWITAAGNPETFQLAGELGAGLLTHLLGQSVDDLAEKLALYRQSWRDRGHPGEGHVTLMLHSFVGDDEAAVRETVRAPMKAYLRSSVDLIRAAAWTFPTFEDLSASTGKSPAELLEAGALDEETMDALLDHAFERYFTTSGLFGTPETCLPLLEQLKAIGVDEVACLIDFGVDSDLALSHLEALRRLKDLANAGQPEAVDGHRGPHPSRASDAGRGGPSIASLITRHGVTHLQCTPSMAGMLLMDEATRDAMRALKVVMIGGEAFPAPLAQQLCGAVSGAVLNMYGPTETTVWSATHRLHRQAWLDGRQEAPPPIGRPIANTTLYVLDAERQPVPPGVPGELYIGGHGVVRGYLHRPELTAERFLHDPFSAEQPGARMYRTGDLVRYLPGGELEFLGRLDHQVKIRGYRIELGEIESQLRRLPAVREAVVMAREDVPGDTRLVAYVIPHGPGTTEPAQLRQQLREKLPDFMVPAHVVVLSELPLTPNGKIDRKQLPAPDQGLPAATHPYAAPQDETERILAEIWQHVLCVERVGTQDNFFDLGGHSLLAMQLIVEVRAAFRVDVPLRSLFGAPTVAGLAAVIRQAQIEQAGSEAVLSALADLEALSDEEVKTLLSQ